MKAPCLVLLTIALAGCAAPEGVPEADSSNQPAARSGAATSSRTLVEIQEAFDRNKRGITNIYNYAARHNRRLGAGKLKFDLTIEPDGTLSSVTLVSSTFGDDDFEATLVEQIKKIRLAPRDVPQFTYHGYPIEFRPL